MSIRLIIRCCIPLLIWIIGSYTADAQLVINEVCSSNDESYIDNNEIIIRNNFDQFNLFGSNIIKEKINLIFIFQKRLVTDNVYTSLYNEGFIKEKLNINNFIIFQK